MKIKIEVKKRHIAEAHKKVFVDNLILDDNCPIVLALQEINEENPSLCKIYMVNELPRSAQRFIKNFDSQKPVKPFKFFINV